MSQTAQLENNIAYCIDDLNLSDDQIGEILRCIERLGIQSVEYFCEEFVFVLSLIHISEPTRPY